jgi:hypothetical protein
MNPYVASLFASLDQSQIAAIARDGVAQEDIENGTLSNEEGSELLSLCQSAA